MMPNSIKTVGEGCLLISAVLLLACGLVTSTLLMGINMLGAVQYQGGTLSILRVILPLAIPLVYLGTFAIGYVLKGNAPLPFLERPVSTYIYETPVNPDEPQGAWRDFIIFIVKVMVGLLILLIFTATIAVATNSRNLPELPSAPSPFLVFEVVILCLLNCLVGSVAYRLASYPMEKPRKLWLGFGWLFITLAGWYNWSWWEKYAYPIGADLLFGVGVALLLSLFSVLYISLSWNAKSLQWKPSCFDVWFFLFFPIVVVTRFELLPRILPPLFFFPLTAVSLYFYIEAWRQRPESKLS